MYVESYRRAFGTTAGQCVPQLYKYRHGSCGSKAWLDVCKHVYVYVHVYVSVPVSMAAPDRVHKRR